MAVCLNCQEEYKMKRLAFPVNFSGDPVGEIRCDELQLVRLLGLSHTSSRDSMQFGGPVKLWAFEVANGIRVVVELHPTKRVALIACEPPDLDGALQGLGLPVSLVSWRRSETPRRD
jgi:hypothetical protein